MRFVRLVAGAGLALLLAAGCSQGDRTPARGEVPGSQTQAVQDGTVDSTNRFAVGVCFGQPRATGRGPSNQGCFGMCSGTLVLPNMVITARHCVSESPAQILCDQSPTFGDTKGTASPSYTNYFITTGTTMTPGTASWHDVSTVLLPPDDAICGNDIAVLILDDLVSEAEAKPVVPGVQYAMNDRTRYADAYAAIGYGNTSPTASDSGTRRIRTPNPITCIPGDEELPCPTGIDPREFVGGDWICSGDSGSGAYERRSFELGVAPVSFGVLSRGGESDDGTKCVGSIYTRLDGFRDFIVEAAAKASNDWSLYGKPTPDWTVYVPPPTKDAGGAPPPPPATVPTGAALGETCAADADCASQLCVDAADGTRVCSKACEEGAELACPAGLSCQGGLCLAETATPAAAPTATRTTTTSCAAAPEAAASSRSPAIAVVALGLTALVRRRRRS